ncbi:MAG TPA: class I SAM-dependent methyltransferase [Candidatus Dormibacteraeota bacterium]|nr:class I SAM-dependent methyltransferase [Candidatus Dormibacteraeota bacterium]
MSPSAPDVAVVREHYDDVAERYDRTTARSHYYHAALKRSLREVVPPGSRVLDVGCATGEMLACVDPAEGVGVDLSGAMVDRARAKFPHLRFVAGDILDGAGGIDETFEVVMSVNLMEHVADVRRVMAAKAARVEPGGILLAITPHPLWALPIFVADRLNLKVPEGDHKWCSRRDLVGAGQAAGLRLRSFDRDFVVPREMPVLTTVNTAPWARPVRELLGVIQRAVFERPRPARTA